jgi:hypothetical protein
LDPPPFENVFLPLCCFSALPYSPLTIAVIAGHLLGASSFPLTECYPGGECCGKSQEACGRASSLFPAAIICKRATVGDRRRAKPEHIRSVLHARSPL